MALQIIKAYFTIVGVCLGVSFASSILYGLWAGLRGK